MIWEVEARAVHLQGPDGLPGAGWHLVVARNVLDLAEVKFFVSKCAVGGVGRSDPLAAFSRWRVERASRTTRARSAWTIMRGGAIRDSNAI